MSTDTNLLGKGLIRLGILVFFFIISPISMTMSFKALDKFTAAPKVYFAYAFIGLSSLLVIFTVYFAFKTFGVLQKAIFNKD